MKTRRGYLKNRIDLKVSIELENMKRMLMASAISVFIFSAVWIYQMCTKSVRIEPVISWSAFAGVMLLNMAFGAASYFLLHRRKYNYYLGVFTAYLVFQNLAICVPTFFLNGAYNVMIQMILWITYISLMPILLMREQIVTCSLEVGMVLVELLTGMIALEQGLYLFVLIAFGNMIIYLRCKAFTEKVEGNSKISSVKNLAETDPMTNLLNRRGLERRIAHIWPLCIRQNLQVAVIMLDIDYFKKYNDSFGHAAGDECIKSVTKVIRAHTKRKTDYAARVGGEEFLVVLTGINQTDAVKWAMECKKDIEKLQIQHAKDNFLPFVTISMGIGHGVPGREENEFWELRNEADRSLYQSKEAGRACIFMGNQMYAKTMIDSSKRQYMKERIFRSL